MSAKRTFGQAFCRYRQKKGLTQKQVEQLYFEQTGKAIHLTIYENDLRSPTLQVVERLAEILRVNVGLIDGNFCIEKNEIKLDEEQ